VLLEIPDDRRIAEGYSRGELISRTYPHYAGLFGGLVAVLSARGHLLTPM
jgi:hypothetical protein